MSILITKRKKENHVQGQRAKKSFDFNAPQPHLFSPIFSPIGRENFGGPIWKMLIIFSFPSFFSPQPNNKKHLIFSLFLSFILVFDPTKHGQY
jgi:hypothetical protein